MSGGSFDYLQRRFYEIYEPIQEVIDNNKREYTQKELEEIYPYRESTWYERYPEDKVMYNYSDEVIEKFKEAVMAVRIAKIYAERTDYLFAGDDNSEGFLKRLEEELTQLKNEKSI